MKIKMYLGEYPISDLKKMTPMDILENVKEEQWMPDEGNVVLAAVCEGKIEEIDGNEVFFSDGSVIRFEYTRNELKKLINCFMEMI